MDQRLIAAIDIGQASTRAALFSLAGPELQLLRAVSVPTPRGSQAELAGGIRAALRQLESSTHIHLLDGEGQPAKRTLNGGGADQWLVTAEAGGPVRVAVAGVIDDISGQSALRAALTAGAAVADLFAVNDGRPDHHKARDLRHNPVDLVIIAGGVDEGLYAGGGGRQVVNMAKTVAMAGARPRYDPAGQTAIIYAGSAEARSDVENQLAGRGELLFADNVRPDLSLENLAGARQVLLDAFRERIMPADVRWNGVAGFAADGGVLPTGMACLHATELIAAAAKENVIVVDIGEAAVNIYSSIDRELNRTVTDEHGLNFDCPADLSALVDATMTWLPQDLARESVANLIAMQRLRPAALPLTWQELMVTQAANRERIRIALEGHRKVAALLRGIHRQRNVDEVLGTYMAVGGQTIVDLSRVRIVLATGRQVTTATNPGQVLGMVLDGLQPQGITQVLGDSQGVLPHLGAMASQDSQLAAQVIGDAWHQRLAMVVAPVPRERGGPIYRRQGAELAVVRVERSDGTQIRETVDYGVVKRIPLAPDEIARVTVTPGRGLNAGAGFGATARMDGGGSLGIVLDGRGRPVIVPQNPARRRARVAAWLRVLEALPDDLLAAAADEEAN